MRWTILLLALALLTLVPPMAVEAQSFDCSYVCTPSTSCNAGCTYYDGRGFLVFTTCGEYNGGTCQQLTSEVPELLDLEAATWPECKTDDDCAGQCPGDVRCDAGGCLCLDQMF